MHTHPHPATTMFLHPAPTFNLQAINLIFSQHRSTMFLRLAFPHSRSCKHANLTWRLSPANGGSESRHCGCATVDGSSRTTKPTVVATASQCR